MSDCHDILMESADPEIKVLNATKMRLMVTETDTSVSSLERLNRPGCAIIKSKQDHSTSYEKPGGSYCKNA